MHSTCYSVINEDCSRRAHEFHNLDFEQTQKCVKDSFGGLPESKWGDASTSNSYIDKEIKYWKDYGTNIYPSLVINQKTYRGQIEPMSVFNAICAGYTETPDQCLKTLHKTKTVKSTRYEDGESIATGLIVGIVLALVLVNVIIVYMCRRKAKREMNSEMQM